MRCALALAWLGLGLPLSAVAASGTWEIGRASLATGERGTLDVRFSGDGRTSAAQVTVLLDPGRLVAIKAQGREPGQCAVGPAGRVRVLAIDESDRPLPVEAFVACRVVIEAHRVQPGGIVAIPGIEAICTGTSSSGSCQVRPGRVEILAPPVSLPPEPQPEPQLAVLLSAVIGTPSVEQLVMFDWAGGETPPLRGLADPRPLSVWPAMRTRAAGAFADMLRRHPDTARARLERYVLVNYPTVDVARRAVDALANDPMVAFLDTGPLQAGRSVVRRGRQATPSLAAKSNPFQYQIPEMGLERAWSWSGGWALVGVADFGLEVLHPSLRAFSASGQYLGGNFLPVYSADLGLTDFCPPPASGICIAGDLDVDELQALPAPANVACETFPFDAPQCAGLGLQPGARCMVPADAGHGTHVAGLIGASHHPSLPGAPRGACPHCGIGMMKISTHECRIQDGLPRVAFLQNFGPAPEGVAALAQTGSQVINMSFGSPMQQSLQCSPPLGERLWCNALSLARATDVFMVASSGNDLRPLSGDADFPIDWPAADSRVVAAGGLGLTLGLWDDRPNCPRGSDLTQCGSNHGPEPSSPFFLSFRQELMAPAKSVLSTAYRGKDWSNEFLCGDSFGGGPTNDGVGLCTGTSMSAPIISGISGILRSINPLVPVGDPFTAVDFGIRDVLAASTDRAAAGLGWDPVMGFGRPDAEVAAKRILGMVAGSTVTNRVTPLFVLWSEGAKDSISVATPQLAVALARYQNAQAESRSDDGPLTPGYGVFPTEPEFAPPVPRAALYVLTTEFSPGYPGQLLPTPIPLYVVERTRPSPDGCTPANPPCNVENRDYALVNSVAELEAAVAGGYNHRGRQGYIYPVCSPEPACMPPGTVRVMRQCNPAIDDCAVFPESQWSLWQSRGYTQPMFSGGTIVLGYAYPNIDSDGDGLINGMEYVIGTNPFAADSNGDGIIDGLQFPQASVSFSDPCSGANTCLRLPQDVFADGFE